MLRRATEPFAKQRAAKWVGDCYLLADAIAADAARKQNHTAILPE